MPSTAFEILHLPDFRSVIQACEALGGIQPDFAPLGSELQRIFLAENERARLNGEDRFDSYLQEIAASTRKGRGPGPPMAPNLGSSRVITRYSVDVMVGPEGIRIRAGWTGIPWL